MSDERIQLNCRCNKELKLKLNAYAKATGISLGEAMRKGALIYYALAYNEVKIDVDDSE